MASQQPIFDQTIAGSNTVNLELWINLLAIPSGKQLLLGYATYAAIDKNCQFELRSNTTGNSTGTTGTTQLHDVGSAPGGSSVDRDLYQFGYVNTLTVTSTGVENLWLRIIAQNSSAGSFDYIVRYTAQ